MCHYPLRFLLSAAFLLQACWVAVPAYAAPFPAARLPGPPPANLQNGASPAPQISFSPSQPPDSGPSPLASVSSSWEGIRSDFTLEPPDPHGAAGPNGIIQVVNVRIAYWDKTGHAIWGPVPLDGMFASVGNRSFSFDPHALYDTLSGRFIVLLLEQDSNNQKSYLNVAVSKTSNPRSSGANDWFLYRLDNTLTNAAGSVSWGDYPGLAFDSQCIYTTVNMYEFTNGYSGQVQIGIIDKAAAQAGNGNINFVYTAVNDGAFTLQPCSVHGVNGPGNVAFLAETRFFDSTHVRVWALTDPLGTPALTSAFVNVPDNGGPPPFAGAPQKGTSLTIDTLDGRTQGNAFWFNKAVWFCHTAGGSSGKSIAYYYRVGVNNFPAVAPVLVEEGSLDGGQGEWTYQPNIGVNSRGDVGLVYSQSSTTRFPTIFGATRSFTAAAFDTPTLIKASPGYYFGGRWGDFASVTPDPVDDSFWMTHEFARSTQIIDWGTWWANISGLTAPHFDFVTNTVVGGNGNGIIDFNECNDLYLVLTNSGSLDATTISASISSTNPAVFITTPTTTYPDMPIGAGGTNLTAFRISTFPTFICGTPIDLTLLLKCNAGTFTNFIRLPTGIPHAVLRFDNFTPASIPDADPAGTNSIVVVSNVTSALNKVAVSLFVAQQLDAVLTLELIAPDGTTNTLTAAHGQNGQNYGSSCSDFQRTIFDDDAAVAIGAGVAPFVGSFTPDTPLSVFAGKSGTNVNGVWKLHAVDSFPGFPGSIQCWSLLLSTADCTDGGGECPGSDLSISILPQPEPVVLGNPLNYLISVTNRGPSSARNVTVAQVLPSSAPFQSATTSQGGYSQNGGVVTLNFGSLPARGWATANVTVLPTITGTISSSASVSSNQQDPDTSNNSTTVTSHVNPPTSDVVVGLSSSPEPVTIGASLTYTVSVTNNGPSPATGVTVSNVLPQSMTIVSPFSSNHVVMLNFGTLLAGSSAAATISAIPAAEGVFSATSTVTAEEVDPQPSNNSATRLTTVSPAADLALALNFKTAVITNALFTNTISVVNNGPSAASSVLLSGSVPSGASFIAASSTNVASTNITASGGILTANIGSLVPGQAAYFTVVMICTNAATFNTTFSISGAQFDPNTANNTASAAIVSDIPRPNIVIDSVNLVTESFSPTNGAVDVGETVSVSFSVRNIGNVPNNSLSATLQTNSGVLPVGANTQQFGVLAPGGAPNAGNGPFTFTANGTNGGSVTATLMLQDSSPNMLPTNRLLNFTFVLPRTITFSNTSAIAIRDNTSGLPYPSTLLVSGLTGTVGKATVTLSNISHTFPEDIDALVAGPGGQDTILMGSAGAPPLSHADVTFDDTAASVVPDISGQIASGSYRPANYGSGSLPAPAPVSPYPAAMSVFNSLNPNGTWSLFVDDHSAGDTGSIAGGWSLSLTLISPVKKIADLSLLASSFPNPCVAGGVLTYTFTITNSGPDPLNSIRFNDALPATVTVLSNSLNFVPVGNTISGVLNGLSAHGSTNFTVTVVPGVAAAGTLVNTASVSGSELDLNLANNTNSVATTITLPQADLGLLLSAATNTVIAGSNVTYTVTLTNAGPGDALNVTLTNTLPPGLSSVTVSNPLGSGSVAGGVATAAISRLAPGSTATVTIRGNAPGVAATLTNTAVVATASQDNNGANNSATVLVTVVAPAPSIVSAGVSLTSESFAPPNGAIDPGENVTVSFSLRNVGVANAASITATLQASGGITPVGPVTQSYGLLAAGGAAAANSFSFVANGTNGGTVVATLLITNGSTFLGTVTNIFAFAATATFSNTAAITIPDHGQASPYPSIITVSNMSGLLSTVKVSLVGFTHTFPRDVNALLVSPAGGNVLLMSHAGGPQAVTNPITLTFDDAASNAIPITGPLVAGANQPAAYFSAVSFPAPAPAGAYGQTLSSLSGQDANGSWKLYVFDDSVGDAGAIGSGWSLQLTTLDTLNPVADLSVGISSAPASLFVGGVYTNTITISNLGPGSATGVLVINSFPFGVSVLSTGSPPPGPFVVATGGSVTLNAGNLAAGASTNLSVVLVPSFGILNLTNTARAGANESDLNLANNFASSIVSAIVATPATLSGSVSNHQFELTVLAEPNLKYIIQASTNLSTWVSLSTNTASPGGTIKYVDATTPAPKTRYYRAVRALP
jgi:uncharacterized repeat protein (TIGR01451 family)